MSEREILPCPFCGGSAHVNEQSGFVEIGCRNRQCPVVTDCDGDTMEEAAGFWNTRDAAPTKALANIIAAVCKLAPPALATAIFAEAKTDHLAPKNAAPREGAGSNETGDNELARERLRLAMLFIEEWANWWAYGLGLDDSVPLSPEETKAAEEKAASFGKRASAMVIDNRRFLHRG